MADTKINSEEESKKVNFKKTKKRKKFSDKQKIDLNKFTDDEIFM
jgi:hypothetical protein